MRRIETACVVNAAGAWAGRVGELTGTPIPVMHGPPMAQSVAELIVNGRASTFDSSPLDSQRFAGEGARTAERVSSL